MSVESGPEITEESQILRVREVRPRWQRNLIIGSAVLTAIASLGGLALQIRGNSSIAQLDPIARSAERFNEGLDTAETWLESMRRAREAAIRDFCGQDGACFDDEETAPEQDKVIEVERINEPDGTRGYEFRFPWLK